MHSRSTMIKTIGASVVVSVAVAWIVIRASHSAGERDESTSVPRPVSNESFLPDTPAGEQQVGVPDPLLKITREIPASAGTNRSGHAVLFGWLDDRRALSLAHESMNGTAVPLGRPPLIERRKNETIVRWPASSMFSKAMPISEPERISVWIDNATMKVIRSRDAVLSIEEALQIAKDRLSDWDYDRTAPIEADCRSSHVQFTFPKRPFEGKRIGFFAKVVVSLETGSILTIEQEAD